MKNILIITVCSNTDDFYSKETIISDAHVENLIHMIGAILAFKPYSVADGIISRKFTHNFIYSQGFYPVNKGEQSAKELYGDVTGFDWFITFLPRPFDDVVITDITSIRLIKAVADNEYLKN